MSNTTPEPKPELSYSFYMVVPHVDEPRFLMLRSEGEGWALPHFEPEGDGRFFAMTGYVNEAARRLLGVHATVLRCARRDVDREVKMRYEAVFFMENHEPGWRPGEGMRWVGREDLAGLELAVPEQRSILEIWLNEAKGADVPENRAPWALPGWYDAVTEWIGEQLAARGIAISGPVEQVKQWGISSIVKAPAGDAYYFLKAVPGLFATEPAITAGLASLFPGCVPEPLAIASRPGEGWMLLEGFEGTVLWDATMEQWDAILRLFAPLQIASTQHISALYKMGCDDRRLDKLALHLDDLVADDEMLATLKAEEREQLLSSVPRLKEMCAQLAGYSIPDTLVHGDFHPANTVPHGEGYLIFDWTDACVAHPFLDMATVLDSDPIKEMPEAQAHLSSVYLERWTEYEPPERLAEALRLALPLGALHQAVSYKRIVDSLEPGQRWELANGRAYWLRIMLKGLREPSAV